MQRLNELQPDFDADDLTAERTGAPDKRPCLTASAWGAPLKLEDELYAAGRPQSEIAADDLLKAPALKIGATSP